MHIYLHEPSCEQTTPNGANSKTYQLRFLSIVRLNEQLWRSAISGYFVIWSIVFHLTRTLNLANPNVSIRIFTGRARHFAFGETVHKAPWSLLEKLAIRCFSFRHVSRTFAAVTCFSIRSHCVTPVFLLFAIVYKGDRKIP